MNEAGIAELIAEIGNDRLTFQMLRHSLVNIEYKNKTKDNEVTFCTNEITPNDFIKETGKEAIILWVDKECLTEAHSKLTKG